MRAWGRGQMGPTEKPDLSLSLLSLSLLFSPSRPPFLSRFQVISPSLSLLLSVPHTLSVSLSLSLSLCVCLCVCVFETSHSTGTPFCVCVCVCVRERDRERERERERERDLSDRSGEHMSA